MRPDSRPIDITINLPPLPDEAVVEIQDFLYAILDLFDTHYGHQVQRFCEDHSQANLIHPKPPQSTDDPPF